MIQTRSIKQLAADQSGVAAVEFALYSVFFFMIALAGLDFGDYYIKNSNVDKSVSAAAVSAFDTRENLKFTDLPAYVRALSEEPSLSVSTSCNGVANSCTNLNRTCACLKQDGTYVAATCGNTCTGSGMTSGTTAGYYLTITASQGYQPIVIPAGVLSEGQISRKTTVRIE